MRNFPLLGGATPFQSISTAACSLLSVRRRKTSMPQRPMAPRRLFQNDNQANNEFTADNTTNALLEELKKSSDDAKAKWNFDFVNEQPLEGNWEWERIEPQNSKDTELSQNATPQT